MVGIMRGIKVKECRCPAAVEYLRDHLGIEFTIRSSDEFIDESIIIIKDQRDELIWQLAGGIESMESYIWENAK
jgi:hypothetical protein